MQVLRTRIGFIVSLIKFLAARILSPVLCHTKKYKDLWLVSERGVDARDNGYHFFAYVKRNHPEINARYVISKESSDRDKVLALGDIINHCSFSHYIALACAKALISTHICGYTPNMYLYSRLEEKLGLKGKRIFLQHGIIKDDLKELYYPHVHLDLFVCGAKAEYEYVKNTYNHPEGVVRYLGLCRYDKLIEKHTIKRQILLMPTWRLYLQHCASDAEFTNSQYYKDLSSIINSSKVNELLEKYDYTIVFYPHFESQRFLHTFDTKYNRVTIADFDDYDVQTLLTESAMLISDYSSVFFDNAYMRKSTLFYQTNEEKYRMEHYREGYFDYRRDGFGDVCVSIEELVEKLDAMLASDCALPKLYEERISRFFTVADNKNCERNFNAVREICG